MNPRRILEAPAIIAVSLLIAISIYAVGMFLLICLVALFAWALGEPL